MAGVAKGGYAEENILKLEEAIINMHKEHPDAIFLTQTSAVPFGWAIKEAWKKAYPDEPVPKMLTVDVGQMKYCSPKIYRMMDVPQARKILHEDPEFDREVKSIEGKIKRYHLKKITVFDEYYGVSGMNAGSEPKGIVTRQTPFLVNEVLSKAGEDMRESLEKGIKIYGIGHRDRGDYFIHDRPLVGPYKKAAAIPEKLLEIKQAWRHARLPRSYNPKVRETADIMKKIGREIGEDIRAHGMRKRVSLESLTVILLLGLGIAYQMPFTGYAVKSLVASSEQGHLLAALLAASCIIMSSALYFERDHRKLQD